MTEPLLITSTQNPKIKRLLELQQKSSERRKSGLFVVEGRRELEHCLAAGYEVESVYVRMTNDESRGMTNDESRFARNDESKLPSNPEGNHHSSFVTRHSSLKEDSSFVIRHSSLKGEADDSSFVIRNSSFFYVAPNVYERIAYRGSTEGIVAIVRAKHLTLESLSLAALPPTRGAGRGAVESEPPLFIVLESVEKPGNLGAVLRSADAAGATAVIVCDPLTDLYNPNLIRASIGACFTMPTVACSSEECIAFLKKHGVQILTAQLQDSKLYYDTPMTGPTAIVMGTESTGLTDVWREAADAHIRIPMLGRLDSLNVSVSAAILLFEAVRQRQNNETGNHE